MGEDTSSWQQRFWSFVQKEEGGCWWWTGHCDTGGYGMFRMNGKYHQAHRVAYALVYGAVSPSKFLLHQCDVKWQPGETGYRKCVHPQHLVEGSPQRNAQEREQRGRGYHGPRRLGVVRKKQEPRKEWRERFWLRVQKAGDDECWLWMGGVNPRNYGKFYADAKTLSAHRMAYILEHGMISPHEHVLHTCDVRYAPGDVTYRRCVNVRHLRIGDHAENMREMREKGRTASGERHGTYVHPERVARGDRSGAHIYRWDHAKGLQHGRYTTPTDSVKLTMEQAETIRTLRREGVATKELAAQFHVSQTQIYRIVNGTRWRFDAQGNELAAREQPVTQ